MLLDLLLMSFTAQQIIDALLVAFTVALAIAVVAVDYQ